MISGTGWAKIRGILRNGRHTNRVGTFLLIGRCLSPMEQAYDTELKRLLVGESIDWAVALSIGSQHFVLPLLFWSLRRKGLLPLLPKDVQDCLEATYELNVLRNRELTAQVIDLARVLNGVAVEPVLLKGAGTLVSGLYDDMGLRMMSDVDVLVPESRLDDCVGALSQRGYREVGSGEAAPGDFHHYEPLVCDDYSTAVELHIHAVHHPFGGLLPAQEIWGQSRPVELGGGAIARLPSPMHFFVNNVIRSQLSRSGRDMAPMYHLYDVVALRQAADAAIAWASVRERFDRAGRGTALRAHLWMIERLFGQPCPVEVPPTRRAQLHWRMLLWSLRSARMMALWRTVSYLGASLGNLRHRPDLRRKLLRPDRWFRRYRAEIEGQLRRDTW